VGLVCSRRLPSVRSGQSFDHGVRTPGFRFFAFCAETDVFLTVGFPLDFSRFLCTVLVFVDYPFWFLPVEAVLKMSIKGDFFFFVFCVVFPPLRF